MNLDLINGTFEMVGGLALSFNVYKTFVAKETKGISILSTIWFLSWGIFNTVYYPSLNQMFSFYAGVFVVLVNAIWITQMIYYSKLKSRG